MWHVGIASFALIFMPLPPRAPTAGRHTGQMATVQMIATAPSASTGAKRGERRGTRDSAVSDETMRWYLKSISSRRLLENHEEVSLAVAVKRLLLWQKAKTTLADALGRPPTRQEWAAECGYAAGDLEAFGSELSMLESAKERMVTSNLRLVVSIAKKFANRGVNIQDLIQEGSFGLMTAVEKFDPAHNCRFSTYAHYWIKQAVSRALADYSRAIRLPVHMNDCVNSIRRQRNAFQAAEGRAPTELELARSLNITEAKLRLALSSSRELVSLEAPCFVNARQSEAKAWVDLIPDTAQGQPETALESALLRERIRRSLAEVRPTPPYPSPAPVRPSSAGPFRIDGRCSHPCPPCAQALDPLEREILCLRFGLEGRDRRSFNEIALVFDAPADRIRQLASRALRKLRRPKQQRHLAAFQSMSEGAAAYSKQEPRTPALSVR